MSGINANGPRNRLVVPGACMGAYMVLTAFLAWHHEPWRDEADNWLMARDASVQEIIRIAPDSGHPPLWSLSLKPLALVGLPPWTQQLVHLLIAWASSWLLLFKSPLPIAASLAILFSHFFSFEYAVVARNYALGILGLLTWCTSLSGKGKRDQSMALAAIILMAFSSVHFLVMAGGAVACELVTSLMDKDMSSANAGRQLNRLTLITAGAALLTSIICLWPTGQGQIDAAFFPRFDMGKVVQALKLAILPRAPQFLSGGWVDATVAVAWSAIVGGTLIRLRRRDPAPILFLAMGLAGLIYIFGFKYFYGTLRHAGTLYVLCAGTFWLALHSSDTTPALKRICAGFFLTTFALNVAGTANIWRSEIEGPFTNAGDTASYLLASGLAERTISCHPAPNCSPVLLHLPPEKQAWFPGLDSWGTHMKWDKVFIEHYSVTAQTAMMKTVKKFGRDGESPDPGILFLTPTAVDNPESLGMRLVHSSPRNAWMIGDEGFLIYALAPGR